MDHSRHSRASQRLKRHGNTLAIRVWICLDLFAELAIVRSRGERVEEVLRRRRLSYCSFIAHFLRGIHSLWILRIVAARRLRPASGRKISSRNCELVGVHAFSPFPSDLGGCVVECNWSHCALSKPLRSILSNRNCRPNPVRRRPTFHPIRSNETRLFLVSR